VIEHALIPGTFDPPTLGHLDLFARAAKLFARVTVGLAINTNKRALFSPEERFALLQACTAGFPNVAVVRVDGLVVEACRALGAGAILRGLRSGVDFDYELQIARTNAALLPGLETLFLPSSPAVAHLSSTLVREIASLRGDCSALAPAPVVAALARRYSPP
jgi:pantetheine-phosphate adenylyltransferase